MCEYKFRNGTTCNEPAMQGSPFCILHIPIPKNNDPLLNQLKELKNQKVREKIILSDFNFEGSQLFELSLNDVKLSYSNFSDVVFKGIVNFNDSQFYRATDFRGAKFFENSHFFNTLFDGIVRFNDVQFVEFVDFTDAKFLKKANFINVDFQNDVIFMGTHFFGNTHFNLSKFNRITFFSNVIFDKKALFARTEFFNNAEFSGVQFKGMTEFYGTIFKCRGVFDKAIFSDDASFSKVIIEDVISFKDARFSHLKSQELACRLAKRKFEEMGDPDEADYYYFKEMVAKRKQKTVEIIRWPELVLMQWIFGYGVYPLRIFISWCGLIFVFALFYWSGNALENASSFIEYLYFSLTNAMTPGFGKFEMKSSFMPFAIIEALFGTFMWAAILTLFARKFSR